LRKKRVDYLEFLEAMSHKLKKQAYTSGAIAKELGISLHRARRNLRILRTLGLIEMVKVGRFKFYCLPESLQEKEKEVEE